MRPCVCMCCVHLIHKSMKDVQPHFPQSTYRRTLHEKFKDFRQISKSIIYKYKERTFENTRTHRDTPTNHSYTVDGGHVLGNVYPTQNLSEQHTHTHSLHGWWRRVETEDRQATEEWRDQFPCHVETASTCSFHSPGKCVHFNLKQRTFHRSCWCSAPQQEIDDCRWKVCVCWCVAQERRWDIIDAPTICELTLMLGCKICAP